jgi:hypothetical protein
MSGPAQEKIAQRIIKKGYGTGDKRSTDAINRVSAPLHHLCYPGLDLLALLYQDNCEANLNTFILKINLRMNKST